MRNVRSELGGLSTAFAGMQQVGKALTYSVTVPIIGIGTAAGKAAMDFDASMRNVSSISQDVAADFDNVSKQVLDFGASIRLGPTAAADAFYTVMSAGVSDTEDAFHIMQVSAMTAEAGLADLVATTETMTSVWLAYGKSVEIETISDSITRMVQVGVGSMDEFSNALPSVISGAVSAGVSIENLTGVMAFLTQGGKSARTAATELNRALTGIVKPSEAMSGALQELGVSGVNELITKFGSLEEAIFALAGTTDGSSEALRELWSTEQGARAVQYLVNNMDLARESMILFNSEVDGATERAHAEQMLSFAAQFDKLKSAVQATGIVFGTQLLPMITPVVDGLRELFLKSLDLSPELVRTSIAAAGVAAALGPVMWIVGSMLSPIGLLITGATALYHAFDTNFMGVRDIFDSVLDSLYPIVAGVQVLKDTGSDILTSLFGDHNETETAQAMVDSLTSVAATAASMLMGGQAVQIEIPVTAGMTLWGLWHESEFKSELQAAFPSYEDYIGYMAETNQNFLVDGDKLVIETGVAPSFIAMDGPDIGNAVAIPFAERLKNAIEANSWRLETAWEGITKGVSDWVLNKFVPAVDGFGSSVLTAITGWFTPQEGWGNTNIYAAFKELVNGNIAGAIDQFLPGVGTNVGKAVSGWFDGLADRFPGIRDGIGKLASTVAAWVISDGIPTLSRAAGYLVGKFGVAMGEALASLGSFLTGGGASGAASGAGDVANAAIVTPFVEGLNDALGEANITDPVDQIFSIIAGVFVAAAGVAGLGALLAGGGFSGAVLASLGFAFKGVILGASGLTTVASGLLSVVGKGLAWSGFTSAAAAGLAQADFLLFSIRYAIQTTAWPAVSAAIGGAFRSAFAAATGLLTSALGAILGGVFAGVGIHALLESSGIAEELRDGFGELFNFDYDEAERNLENSINNVLYGLTGSDVFFTPYDVSVPIDFTFQATNLQQLGSGDLNPNGVVGWLMQNMGFDDITDFVDFEGTVSVVVGPENVEFVTNSLQAAQLDLEGAGITGIDFGTMFEIVGTADAIGAAIEGAGSAINDTVTTNKNFGKSLIDAGSELGSQLQESSKIGTEKAFTQSVLDPAIVTANTTTPITAAFALAFGVSIPGILLLWSMAYRGFATGWSGTTDTFVASTSASTGQITKLFATMAVEVGKQLVLAMGSLTTASGGITTFSGTVGKHIDMLTKDFQALATAATSAASTFSQGFIDATTNYGGSVSLIATATTNLQKAVSFEYGTMATNITGAIDTIVLWQDGLAKHAVNLDATLSDVFKRMRIAVVNELDMVYKRLEDLIAMSVKASAAITAAASGGADDAASTDGTINGMARVALTTEASAKTTDTVAASYMITNSTFNIYEVQDVRALYEQLQEIARQF